VISNDMLPISMPVRTDIPGEFVSTFSTTGIDSVGNVTRKWEVCLTMRSRQTFASLRLGKVFVDYHVRGPAIVYDRLIGGSRSVMSHSYDLNI